MEELIALYSRETSSPVGAVPRSTMRRENLPHASTSVLLRNTAGEVYVHQRTDSKDLYPSYWDCWAGGVVDDGEDPAAAAVRELREELGVSGVPLRPLGEPFWFADDRTTTLIFAYEAVWDGPVVHQPSEVARGAWWPVPGLERVLRDADRPFMPDARVAYLRYFG